uniref:ABC transporter system integral membrane protein n=1 Tax=Nonomuraea gerenzanensis TaxID=93944 RepID=A0A1M4ECQ3_9ACTN|nr:ABC transporter system integral membrane protein [Nonomuraea gerenzanensis]
MIAAETPREAYEGEIVLDGIDFFRRTMRGPLARYDVLLGRLVAIGIVIGLVPAGKKGPGMRPFARNLSFTPLIDTLRGLLSGPPSAGLVIMAIAGCAGLLLIGFMWGRALLAKRA